MLDVPGKLARAFERAGPLLARLQNDGGGPFRSDEDLLERAQAVLAEMTEAEQIAVIDAHPRIGEHPGKVSAESFTEQRYDRDTTPPEVYLRLARLNEEYEQKFGFRFVVFVNRRPKEALVPVLEARLRGTRDEERRTALGEIMAIARDRLRRM